MANQSIKPITASFNEMCKLFFAIQKKFDKANIVLQEEVLLNLLNTDFKNEKLIIKLHHTLLFSIAYPPSLQVFNLANQVMEKLVKTVEFEVKYNPNLYYNSGITGSIVCAQFGLLLNKYLLEQQLSVLQMNAINGDDADLVTSINYTLDVVEQELMADDAGYFKKWQQFYLKELLKDKQKILNYYIQAAQQMAGTISQKERVFAGFQLFTQFSLDRKLLGLSLGRQTIGKIHLHQGINKSTDIETIFSKGNPRKINLSTPQKLNLIVLARGTMASLLRETDTFTYAQAHETELFELGNGITVALYFMIPEQKFSLQSYIGYLLFKNGAPMAYGGCWLFAKQAAFGVNVLTPYRGGESANVVCELLRLYHFRFSIDQFTVDPYQIGKGNKDGINSGAFWFYYKLGFRPIQNEYALLAQTEFAKISADKSYKTPPKVLNKLANSELYWKQTGSNSVYYQLIKVSKKISAFVNTTYKGDRKMAIEEIKKKYRKVSGKKLDNNSFATNLLLTITAIGAFEKLSKIQLVKLIEAYHIKANSEAISFQKIQKHLVYLKLFELL